MHLKDIYEHKHTLTNAKLSVSARHSELAVAPGGFSSAGVTVVKCICVTLWMSGDR